MSEISPESTAARENARQSTGEFGPQGRTAPATIDFFGQRIDPALLDGSDEPMRDACDREVSVCDEAPCPDVADERGVARCVECDTYVASSDLDEDDLCPDCSGTDDDDDAYNDVIENDFNEFKSNEARAALGRPALAASDSTLPLSNDPASTFSIDENGTSGGGDNSVGIEASKLATWRREDGLYVTVEVQSWVQACLIDEGSSSELDYTEWEEAKTAHAAADEHEEWARGIENGLAGLDGEDRQHAEGDIARFLRYAQAQREEHPGELWYVVKERHVWTLHEKADDPFSDVIDTDYEPDEEPLASAISTLSAANAEVKSRVERNDFSHYSPQNAFKEN